MMDPQAYEMKGVNYEGANSRATAGLLDDPTR